MESLIKSNEDEAKLKEAMGHLEDQLHINDVIVQHIWEIESVRCFAMHEAMQACEFLLEKDKKLYNDIRYRVEKKFGLNTSGIIAAREGKVK